MSTETRSVDTEQAAREAWPFGLQHARLVVLHLLQLRAHLPGLM